MAYPLIPFIAGAAVGGLATFLMKDKKARQEIRRTAGDLSDKAAAGIEHLRKKTAGKENAPAAAKPVKATSSGKAAVKKNVTAAKTTSRKTPVRKTAASKTEQAPAAEPAEKKPS